jgi:hypothetical protein
MNCKAMPLFLAPRDANDERRGSREVPVLDRLVDRGMPVATREAGSTAAPPFALQAAGRPDATVDLEPLISGRGNPSRLCPGSSTGRAGVSALHSAPLVCDSDAQRWLQRWASDDKR